MSRKFNEAMEHRFELFGEEYELVEPTNLEELAEAIKVRELLQQGCDTFEPDSGHPYYHLQRTQQSWIDGYMKDLGDFDNSLLTKNIAYLTKKHGIRMGDLEKILGISPGYISRTSKNNSAKKMSIDNVWRIAKIFGVELSALLETDLQVPNQNTALVSQFLDKLKTQTERNQIEWENLGGVVAEFDRRLAALEMFQEQGDEVIYKPHHLNPEAKFFLADDVYACKSIKHGSVFIMVAYMMDNNNRFYHVDYYFLHPVNNVIQPLAPEKAFCTADDRTGLLDRMAKGLMNQVQTQEMDTKISPEVRSFISSYLG